MKIKLFSLAFILGIMTVNAENSGFQNQIENTRQLFSGTNGRLLTPERPFSVNSEMHPVRTAGMQGPMRAAVDDPVGNYNPTSVPSYNTLEGPDGTLWYYTAKYDYVQIRFNEYYTETVKTAFTFTIYDSNNKKVGQIHDVLRFAENERWDGNGTWYGRDVECVLDPAISINFFNDDDNPEVMVYHAMNTVNYINHYYYSVYSIGGKKDKDGNDIAIATIEGRCIEARNISDNPDEENFLYTFVIDPVVDWPLNDPDALEKLHASYFDVITYSKDTDGTGPNVLISKKIGNTRIPGDTTEGIYFMSKTHKGNLYFIYSQYEKPCFVDPRGGALDESQTPDNALMIEVYAISPDSSIREVSTTRVPLIFEQSDDQLIYTFLSIGSIAWTDDVDMAVNGTPDAPAFVVARDVAAAAAIDDMITSIHIYDNSGNMLHTVADNSESLTLFRNGVGEEPLLMFVSRDENMNLIFKFVTLYTARLLATISQANNGDPLYASCVPIKDDNDNYWFVFEMQYFDSDDDGNLYARVAWFDTDGDLERIDNINLGPEVQASLVYMAREALKPDLFDTDDKMEYAVLVKRMKSNTTRNEYLIVDDNGGRYATFSADDGKGDPYLLTVLPGNPNRLLVNYSYSPGVLYNLPFVNPSVGGREPDDDTNTIESINADNESQTEYFDIQGRRIYNPSNGIYLRKNGNSYEKITIK